MESGSKKLSGTVQETESLHTEAIFDVRHDQKEIVFLGLKFGNSGLELAFSNKRILYKDDETSPWLMHFRPESSIKPKPENRLQYSRMFAAGFVSMIHTLVSEKVKTNPDLSKTLNEYLPARVGFNTNDKMWNFVCKLVGEKYFIKVPQDFSKIPLSARDPIRRIMDEKGWPGDFLLSDFLADYSADPAILENCTRLGSGAKLDNLRVKK